MMGASPNDILPECPESDMGAKKKVVLWGF
jgi:hypothetical protein